MTEVSCFTAPGEVFTNRGQLQEHYKSDWHRYNLKRKVAGLPPLPRAQFEARKAAAMAAKQEQEAKASEHKQDHVKDDKKLKVLERNTKRSSSPGSTNAPRHAPPPPPPPAPPAPALGQGLAPPLLPHSAEGAMADVDAAVAERADGLSEDGDLEEGDDASEAEIEVNLSASLFDSYEAADLEEALAYMATKYGFFLPDVEYLSDLEGLMNYLHQKVHSGRCCLYCGKLHRTAQACKQHMRDKAHCKILYDTQDDMDEISDFYDFSRDVEYYARNFGTPRAAAAAGSGGAVAAMADGDEVEDEEKFEAEVASRKANLEVLPNGELLVTRADGTRATLGVRWLRQYYTQNAAAIDDRESIKAAQKEKLKLLYSRMGVNAQSALMKTLVAASTDLDGSKAESRALAKALNRSTSRYTHGEELKQARNHFAREHLKVLKNGLNENWNIKNRFRETRLRVEGMGVHG